jgi:hypothetical protein
MLQTVLDDAHFQMLRFFLKPLQIEGEDIDTIMKQVKDTVATDQKLYISSIRPMLRSGKLSMPYPFESEGDSDNVMELAYGKMQELLSEPVKYIDKETTEKIFKDVPGILPRLNPYS